MGPAVAVRTLRTVTVALPDSETLTVVPAVHRPCTSVTRAAMASSSAGSSPSRAGRPTQTPCFRHAYISDIICLETLDFNVDPRGVIPFPSYWFQVMKEKYPHVPIVLLGKGNECY